MELTVAIKVVLVVVLVGRVVVELTAVIKVVLVVVLVG